MGRHRASNDHAARYVGRVGALALALGIGAAVSGGAGLASADDTADAKPAGETSPGPAADEKPAADATPVSTGTKRKPNLLDVPKMVLGIAGSAIKHGPGTLPRPSRPTTVPATGQKADPDSDTDADTQPNRTKRSKTSDRSGKPAIQRDDAEASPGPDQTVDVAVRSRSVETVKPSSPPPVAAAPQSLVSFAAPALAASTRVAPSPTPQRVANPVAMVVSNVLRTLGFSPTAAGTGDIPRRPMPLVLGTLQLISRELERNLADRKAQWAAYTSSQPTTTAYVPGPAVPAPTDDVETPYGDIGKWMLQSNGQIANYGGLPYEGRTVLEPVNVIIVDERSKTPEEAAARLNSAMFWSGFPAQPIHSGGFTGNIDDIGYGQEPSFPLLGYSDNLFIFDNNHGRIFGPDPVESSTGGYVWSGAFSTETLVLNNGLPTHGYVSSNMARNALAARLILSGQATFVGMQKMDNAYDTATTTTGDHDGYAVVLRLR